MREKTELKDYSWKHTDHLDMNGLNSIYKGLYKNMLKDEQYPCAIKIINKDMQLEDEIIKQINEQDTQAIQELQGENIIILKDIIEEKSYTYRITKYYKQGNLRDYMHKQADNLNEGKAVYILNQILKGMHTMQQKNYVHRDLKPEYILIHENQFHICGFGFSKKIEPGEEMDFYGGSLGYMSPQIIMRTPYTEKSDIWSVGCIFYEMLTGDVPGKGNNDLQRILDIKNNKVQYPFRYQISNAAKEFIDKCLAYEESDRFCWQDSEYFTKTYSKTNFINQKLKKQESNQPINDETRDCLKMLQNYFIQEGPNASKLIFQEYFQNDEINFNQFRQLLAKFKLGDENMRNLFDYFDFVKDGNITVQEFEYRIYQTDYNEQFPNLQIQNQVAKGIIKDLKNLILKNDIKIDRLFEQFNTNNDDVIDPDEFYILMKKVNRDITQIECHYCFQYFDVDSSGSITLQEFKDAIDLTDKPNSQIIYLQEHKGQKLSSTEYAIINQIKTLIQKYELSVDLIFSNFDENVQGSLTYEQFQKFIKTCDSSANEQSISSIFNVFQDDQQFLQFENFKIILN